MSRYNIYLSPPHLMGDEYQNIATVLDSGWIAPIGEAIDEFESRLATRYSDREVVALNSGTSALHLSLILAGVQRDDHVVVSSFTFAACANVVHYQGAIPIFIDSETETWNLDPHLLHDYLRSARQLPKAIIVTHLYGMPAQIEKICSIASQYGVIVIEDAAEALGATIGGREVGGFGDFGILSFNGNKIITTSAGGALITKRRNKPRAIHLATQANVGYFGYDHHEVGYNYRMSNVLAALGLAQLDHLGNFLSQKRTIFYQYVDALGGFFDFLNEPDHYISNRWLTTGTIKSTDREIGRLIQYLADGQVETRRLWKPLHQHKAYLGATYIGDGICEHLFEKGICLPSGTGLSKSQQEYVIAKIKQWFA